MGGVVAVVAAQRARLMREFIAHLRDARAFSAQTATPLQPQRRMGQQTLRSMINDGSVIRAGDDLYWLDENAYALARKRRISRVVWIMFAAAILVAAVVIFTPIATHHG